MSPFGAVFVESASVLSVSAGEKPRIDLLLRTESLTLGLPDVGRPCPKTEAIGITKKITMKRVLNANRTVSGLTIRSLDFIEKFTNLWQFIAKHPSIINTVRNIGLKTLLIAITLLNLSSVTPPRSTKIDVIMIDPGHGGRDPGTMGKTLKEKDVALKISLKLGKLIENNIPGVKVLYTRKDDKYVDLADRPMMANNQKADLFICVHANAVKGTNAYGTETYIIGPHRTEAQLEVAQRENSVMLLDENKERYEGFDPNSPESYILFSLTQSSYQESSLNFAQKIESQFKNKAGRYSRGVRQAGFWVLWKSAMPSVLVETGFLTNPTEESYLGSAKGQDEIAAAIYRAFKDYKTQIESVN
jgi:N-acetylmuramoyl-L-alanine amidase